MVFFLQNILRGDYLDIHKVYTLTLARGYSQSTCLVNKKQGLDVTIFAGGGVLWPGWLGSRKGWVVAFLFPGHGISFELLEGEEKGQKIIT